MGDRLENSYITFDKFRDLGFTAGVTTKGPWENPDNMYEFIRQNLIPCNKPLVVPDQVHGVDIIHIDQNMNNYSFEADGVITSRGDIALSVTTADCLPLVLADPTSGYFAAVHVGWRSFVGGIVENLFHYIDELNMDLDATHFLLGPGIGDCCFKVGPEVAMLFDEQFIRDRQGSFYVNLGEAVGNKLKALGVVRDNIGVLSECTSCRSDLYYSYRRDKETPLQMVTYIFRSI